jgi:streptogramin lyase
VPFSCHFNLSLEAWARKKGSFKVLRSKIVLRYILVFLTLIVCATLTLGAVHPSFASPAIPTTVTATDFSVPSGIDPWGTTFDSSGNVWLAVPGCDPTPTCSTSTPPGKIEVFNPSSSSWTQTLQLPSGYAQALFLAFDKKGRLWFPAPMSNELEMYNTTSHSFQKWKVPTPNALPWDVAIDHKGKVWFTEHNSNKIGRFDPTTHTFTEIATTASNSMPYGITVDAKNNIWFTENNSAVALIAEYTSTGHLKEYKIRNTTNSALTPHMITVDPNGNIWWSEGFAAAIGELKVAQAVPGTNKGVSEFFYPFSCNTCGTHTSGISVDSNGNIWFDDSNQSIFGSFPDNGTGSFSIYNTPTSNSHPHDGLSVNGQNRIWFDEEFANKLAKAIQ